MINTTSGAAAAVARRFGGGWPRITPENILDLRKREGLTQQSLANALGVTVTAVSFWERGTRTPRGASLRLLQLASLHGIERLLRDNANG